jgi:hypothetical protein
MLKFFTKSLKNNRIITNKRETERQIDTEIERKRDRDT